MIVTLTAAQLATYDIDKLASGDIVFIKDTDYLYFVTNNIDGGTPRLYRASIASAPTEAVTPVVTLTDEYIYSGKPITTEITLNVTGISDPTKLADMKLEYGAVSQSITSVPTTISIPISATTEIKFSGVYDRTPFTQSKTITEVCPIYVGVTNKTTSAEIIAEIVNDAHLVSADNPLPSLEGYATDFTIGDGYSIAYISGKQNTNVKDTRALGNDALSIKDYTTTLGSFTAFLSVTTPMKAQAIRSIFHVE